MSHQPTIQYYIIMVKVYFSYSIAQVLGLALSKSSNFLYDPAKKLFVTGASQYVTLISAKTGEVQAYLSKKDKNVAVRLVALFGGRIYAGYEDGEIVVWGLHSHEQLFCFDLHKSTVSSMCVSEEEAKLVSAGFDGNIMIWDLVSEECQCIKSAHPSIVTQVLAVTIDLGGKPTAVVMSVGKDGFFRLWDMNSCACLAALSCQVTEVYCMHFQPQRNVVYIGTNKEQIVTIGFNGEEDGEPPSNTVCSIRGTLKKKSFSRCTQIFVDHSIMYFFNADRTIELYKILTNKEIDVRRRRVRSRRKKGEDEQPQEPLQSEIELKFIEVKVVPFKFYNGFVVDSRIFVNNGTNIYELGADKQLTHGIGRTNQLCLQYPFAVQRSPTALHIYSSSTMSKLFSIQAKAEWCQLFSSGLLLVVDATSLQIWNLSTNEQLLRLQEKWSGGCVKKSNCLLWRENELSVFQVGYNKHKQLKMKKLQQRKFQEKITEVQYKNSMDKYIVNLQNAQIVINYSDTHKNFLKLYGHKMPILSFDISSDDGLLATGATDKDIRLWDMDYGHCIKSIFAHQEAVTVVKFVAQTHYLFSGSKDGHLKFWDMDTHQLVMNFEENIQEIKALAVSSSGDTLLAGGLDEGLRVWKQGTEQTIASDMEERQMEKVMIEDYARDKLGQRESKTRYEDLKHGEQIIEALEGKEPPKTIISLVKQIPPANLGGCLSFLHERHVRRLEEYLKLMIDGNYEQETCWRIVRDLNRGSELGSTMRDVWRPIQKLVQLNTQILKTLLQQIEIENQRIQ